MVWVNHCEVVEPRIDGTKSDPADSMNTMTAPDAMPGLACGSTMRQWIFHHGAPKSSAASIWIVNAYQIAIVVALLPLASLGEIVGYRRVSQAGLAVFTLASIACVFANSIETLSLARVVQGFGAAGIMSVNGALVRYTYPQRLLGRAVGINAVIVSLAAAAALLGTGETPVPGGLDRAELAAWVRLALYTPLALVVIAISHRHGATILRWVGPAWADWVNMFTSWLAALTVAAILMQSHNPNANLYHAGFVVVDGVHKMMHVVIFL